MAGRYLAAVATFAAISISFSFIIPQAASHLSETLPSSLNAVNRMIPDAIIKYQAPLYRPDPRNTLIPNSYTVVLAPGVSFEQHKEALGDKIDLDRLAKPISTSGTVIYAAEFDDAQLAIIRADRSVEAVDCNFTFKGIDDGPINYQAPLHTPDPGVEVVPNSYLIMLAQGSSFEQHKQAMGDKLDLDRLAKTTVMVSACPSDLLTTTSSTGQWYAGEFDDAQLTIIRADLNVAHVEYSFVVKLIQ